VAREQLVLVSSGGSDWLVSSGKAEEVDGGYRINARKIFSSGSPAGDLLLTSAVYDDPEAGPTVLHFPIALNHPQVKILSNWRTLGMRGTGSNDVLIENVFVPAEAVNLRRPRGCWHPALHLVSKVALPMVYSAYVGIAEAARDLAVREVQSKRENVETQFLAGELENELFNARLAYERLVELGASALPGVETTDAVLKARTLAAQAAIQTVEKAVELVGGRSFYRSLGLERLYRDVQAARFHPLPEKLQQRFAGRVALGLSPDV
jgi:acyl-CoA dehydrogenase